MSLPAAAGSGSNAGAANFSELMTGTDGTGISQAITDSYDVLYGSWPEAYNEVVLVLNEDNGISAETLCQLGFITEEQYENAAERIENGGEAGAISFDYEKISGHIFYLVPACDYYMENENGTFTYMEDSTLYEEKLLENAVELKITGIIRPKEDARNAAISTAVAYTPQLTDYIISHTDESPVIRAQEADSSRNMLTGMAFETSDDAAKAKDAKEYLSSLSISEKASFYQLMVYYTSENTEAGASSGGQTGMAAKKDPVIALRTEG